MKIWAYTQSHLYLDMGIFSRCGVTPLACTFGLHGYPKREQTSRKNLNHADSLPTSRYKCLH